MCYVLIAPDMLRLYAHSMETIKGDVCEVTLLYETLL